MPDRSLVPSVGLDTRGAKYMQVAHIRILPATAAHATVDTAVNASNPKGLVSRDRVFERVQSDPILYSAALVSFFRGCDARLPDPVYPAR